MNMTINDDLVFQILLWLPIAPLHRFKSVCKTWFSIIQSSQFLDQHHLHIHVHPPTSTGSLLLKKYTESLPVFSVLSGENYQVSHDIPDSSYDGNYYNMVTSCNGIICEIPKYDYATKVTLWNPATQQSRCLPESCFGFSELLIEHCCINVGFFYDCDIDDCKVIRFFFCGRLGRNSWVEIYSMRTDSWREITCELPITRVKYDPRVPYRRDTYCWLGVDDDLNSGGYGGLVILTFLITKEVFGTIPLPDKYRADFLEKTGKIKLAIIRDELLFINWQEYSSETEIWMWNDYGVKCFWTKAHSLQVGANIGCSVSWVGTSNDGIILLQEKGARDYYSQDRSGEEDRKMWLYNIVTQEISVISILKPMERVNEVVQYKKSLVSVESKNGGNSKVCSVEKHD